MKIEFDGRTWQYDELDITNKQADKIRAHTGLSVAKWMDSLHATDAVAWESSFDVLYWLMLQQNRSHAIAIGQDEFAISDVDYPVYRFIEAYGLAKAAENPPAAEAEPDPTRPAAASARSRERSSLKAKTPGQGGVKPDG